MAAKRRGEKIRWRVVVVLEVVKALCRVVLMRLTNTRPLVSPPLPEREVDPRALEVEAGVAEEEREDGKVPGDGMESPEPVGERGGADSSLGWTMPRTGLSLPSLPDSHDISEYLLKKVLTADDIKPARQLLRRVTTTQGQVAELMWIARPVLYALAMQKWCQEDRKSWRPWVLGVSVEIAARQLAKKDLAERVAGGWRGLTGLEREELRRRGWGVGWWVLRGGFYENVTK